MSKFTAWIAGAVTVAVVGVIIAAFLITTLVFTTVTTILGSAGAGVVDNCIAGGVSYGKVNTDRRFFTTEENAGRVYAQAMGLGLGEVGALAGLTAALQESSLKNGGRGDDAPDGTMTESRGMFQQKAAWVERGRAWSGLKWTRETSETMFSDVSPITGKKDPWNAWTGVQWALRDPRMDHAQSSNMFFLGPQYNKNRGMEDSAAYKKNAALPAALVSYADIAEMVQDTQGASIDRSLQLVPAARKYLDDILVGKIQVPAFVPPEPAIAKRATTRITRTALRTSGVSTEEAAEAVSGDGLLLVGDSVMQGITRAVKVPKELFSGPTTVLAQRSMTLNDVLYREGVKTVSGTRADLDAWRETIVSGPSRILVQLGTNNSSANTVEGVSAFMDLAGSGREVFWFSMHYQRAKSFDDALLTAARSYPNLHIIDTSALVETFSEVHPSKEVSIRMWDKAVEDMSGSTAIPAQLISVQCEGEATNAFNDTVAATGPYRRAAVLWARTKLTSVTKGQYTTDNNWCGASATGCGDPELDDFNCSTYTSAAFQAATNGEVVLPVLSDSQWLDKTNVQLIPSSQAQPGDLLWQKTSTVKLSGHVLLIESLEGQGTVLHSANPDIGIVRGELKNRGKFLALKDPSNPSRGADNIKYTDNWDEAYVGRVLTPQSA
jgi:hypothetical protein